MSTPEPPIGPKGIGSFPQEFSRLLALCQAPADLPPDYEYARLSRQTQQEAFREAICRMELARSVTLAFVCAQPCALTRARGLTGRSPGERNARKEALRRLASGSSSRSRRLSRRPRPEGEASAAGAQILA